MAVSKRVAHHIKALPPALRAMQALGFDAPRCLAGTGIDAADLQAEKPGQTFTLEQEFRFHRNLLELSGDPLLGLTIGKAYKLQTYGLLGYAFMSAPTLRQAMTIVCNYALLSFSFFAIHFRVEGKQGVLRFSQGEHVPPDLLTYYVDRDLTAVAFGGDAEMPEPLAIDSVMLAHDNKRHRAAYERVFDCPVSFNGPCSELRIDSELLDAPMPLRDAQTSAMCQQQCDLLLARMKRSTGFVDEVRSLIVARPGYFPDIDYVAERLNLTSRTLRRRLAEEDSSFQQILAEVRYQLAREYLGTSQLPVEEISVLLGYSTPGNFTHAFKRWHGSSPRQFRQESQ